MCTPAGNGPRPPDSFATLAQVFQQVRPTVGFNIEVKYPTLSEVEQHQLTSLGDINECVGERPGARLGPA